MLRIIIRNKMKFFNYFFDFFFCIGTDIISMIQDSETVLMEYPDSLAISFIVTIFFFPVYCFFRFFRKTCIFYNLLL